MSAKEPTEPVLLYRAPDSMAAALIVQALTSRRIPLSHTGGMSAIGMGELGADAQQVDIWVPVEFAEEGKRVIEEHQRRANETRADAREWTCAFCSEANDGSFEVCWQCGALAGDERTDGD